MNIYKDFFVGDSVYVLGKNIVSLLTSSTDMGLSSSQRGVLLCDKVLKEEFVHKVRNVLMEKDISVEIVYCDVSERNKNYKIVEECYKALDKNSVGRDGFFISMGGGVITDLGGFVASTWLRGINYISIPTTLLGIVDASIGGKCGINRVNSKGNLIKNTIGSFYFPSMIISDIDFLKTLKPREWKSALGEIIKHGIIGDVEILNILEGMKYDMSYSLGQENLPNTFRLIEKSIEVKKNIIDEDLMDIGKRSVLNLGHTFAHAIESQFSDSISHGESVCLGILSAIAISNSIEGNMEKLSNRLESIYKKYKLPTKLPISANMEQLINIMKWDKKTKSNEIYLVLPMNEGVRLVKSNKTHLKIGWERILSKR